jgi:hypothetical protein
MMRRERTTYTLCMFTLRRIPFYMVKHNDIKIYLLGVFVVRNFTDISASTQQFIRTEAGHSKTYVGKGGLVMCIRE